MTTRDIDRATFDWADYDHFLAFGWSHERIAARLGVNPHSLSVALSRAEKRKNARTERAA